MSVENTAKGEDISHGEVRRKSYSMLWEMNKYPGM